ncbi:hypothetical protein FRB94_004607 [Tulasnella sp. JGI-2019a]|nr:hypothetical protein FRB94_004607 [Tulasnella sp. JGI-2019a]KAG9003435.1 hypothetical protein FRB93_011058 [Tulasnella sp. JGI-2019a]KAG9024902.1 hypothetical protein FRB95_010937 [Tulasnella sp. JGI-2019a]
MGRRSWFFASNCLEFCSLDNHVKTAIADHFKKQTPGGLRDAVVSVTSEEICKRFHNTLAEIDDLCQSENLTRRDHNFFDYKSKIPGVYKEVYR